MKRKEKQKKGPGNDIKIKKTTPPVPGRRNERRNVKTKGEMSAACETYNSSRLDDMTGNETTHTRHQRIPLFFQQLKYSKAMKNRASGALTEISWTAGSFPLSKRPNRTPTIFPMINDANSPSQEEKSKGETKKISKWQRKLAITRDGRPKKKK